ncbi:MAG: signal peptidase II [Gammaproteobacteria bacterium]
MQKSSQFIVFAVIALSTAGVAQATGLWVNSSIEVNTSVEINSLLHFTHVRNYGGVFGMFQGMGWLFGLISVVLLSAVTAYLWFSKQLQTYEYVCFGFIVGGGASNILDRFIHGSVIDFIDIQQIPYWNYVFNTGDVMVHLGIWPLLIISLFFDHKAKVNAP